MPQTLASDIAQKSLDVLIERAGQPRNGSADDTQEILDNCEIPYLLIERLWRSVQESLDRGVEERKFLGLLKDCLAVIERATRTMETVRERVKSASLSPLDKAKGLSLLDRLDQSAVKKRDELTKLLRWIERPRPEIDLSKLPVTKVGREAEGFIDHDELMDQFLTIHVKQK